MLLNDEAGQWSSSGPFPNGEGSDRSVSEAFHFRKASDLSVSVRRPQR